MTTQEVRQQIKATALNSIRKLYNKQNRENGVGVRSNHWDGSWAEQRDEEVICIIDKMEDELNKLKNK
jgi:hypothetical protein